MRALPLLIGLFLSTAATAAAAPATNPAPDLSSPTRAARAFARAMESGDMASVRAVTVGPDDDYRLLEQTVRTAAAARQLEDAAVERFGEGGKGIAGPAARPPSAVLDEDGVTETIDGDAAAVGFAADPAAMKFRRVGADWKLDLGETFPALSEASAARAGPTQQAKESMLLRRAGRIRAGEFTTAAGAGAEIQSSLAILASAARTPRGTPAAPAGAGRGGGAVGPKGPAAIRNPAPGRADAKRIVFVCSAAGSMEKKMPTLKDELGKAVSALKPGQSYNVVFYRGGRAIAFRDDGLVPATPENKQQGRAFLEGVTTRGDADPLAALSLAFRQRPELIYLLTDGDFPDNEAVLKRIQELGTPVGGNPPVRVNTIAFVDDANADAGFHRVLQEIARDSGGTFRFVSESDLKKK